MKHQLRYFIPVRIRADFLRLKDFDKEAHPWLPRRMVDCLCTHKRLFVVFVFVWLYKLILVGTTDVARRDWLAKTI